MDETSADKKQFWLDYIEAASRFANVSMGGEHYAYASEIWFDVTSLETAKVMANRMDMAVALGCDGVELDNVDGFVADTGLNITYEQELAYQRLA